MPGVLQALQQQKLVGEENLENCSGYSQENQISCIQVGLPGWHRLLRWSLIFPFASFILLQRAVAAPPFQKQNLLPHTFDCFSQQALANIIQANTTENLVFLCLGFWDNHLNKPQVTKRIRGLMEQNPGVQPTAKMKPNV